MNGTASRPHGWRVWWVAVRPKTLGLSINPVLLGCALAWSQNSTLKHPEAPLIILLCAVAIQAGTNLFNDVHDHLNGTDTDQRLGPLRVTASGWALPHTVSIAALTFFLVALLGGMYLIQIGGWSIFWGGLAALTTGYLYSHGPLPISRTPFGELVVMAFFGVFAVSGTVFLITESWAMDALVLGVVMGFPASAVLMLNNIRDQNTDQRAGRKTLAIFVGGVTAQKLYGLLMAAPSVCIVLGVIGNIIPVGALAGVVALPIAVKTVRTFRTCPKDHRLNPVLGETVRYQFALAATISVGLVSQFFVM